MMNRVSVVLFLTFFVGRIVGQDTSYSELKIHKTYHVRLSETVTNKKHIYEVNDKRVSKRTYTKYDNAWKELENCRPCILQTYSIEKKLMFEGVQYTDCRVGWFKSYYENGQVKEIGQYTENPTGEWDDLYKRGYCSTRTGVWTFFNEKGDTLYQEYWDNGTFIKQVPEQSKVEIWDVELVYNNQELDSIGIPIDRIGELSIRPKYKNRQRSDALSILFSITAVGYRANEKKFTLESFKNIDVREMLREVGIPPDNPNTIFGLTVFENDQIVHYFDIKVISGQ